MAISDLKRFLVPGALVVGGVTAGSLLAPIGLAAADEDGGDADTTVPDSDESAEWAGRPGHHHHPHHHHPHRHNYEGMRARFKAAAADVITETLGLTTEELRAELAEGKSLADVAIEQGVDVEDLKAALLAAGEERIDQAVAAGHLHASKADELKAELADRIDDFVNRVHDGSMADGQRRRHHGPLRGALREGAEALADFLGLTTEELRAAHQDGQTLAEIAEAQGVSEDELVAFLLGRLEERLDQAVENGRIDTDRLDELLAEAEARVEERIKGEAGPRFGHPGPGHGGEHGHHHGHGHGPGHGYGGEKTDTSFGA